MSRCWGASSATDFLFWAANSQGHGPPASSDPPAVNPQHASMITDYKLMVRDLRKPLERMCVGIWSNVELQRVQFTTDRHHLLSGLESSLKFTPPGKPLILYVSKFLFMFTTSHFGDVMTARSSRIPKKQDDHTTSISIRRFIHSHEFIPFRPY
jgi:hypothetical protein